MSKGDLGIGRIEFMEEILLFKSSAPRGIAGSRVSASPGYYVSSLQFTGRAMLGKKKKKKS